MGVECEGYETRRGFVRGAAGVGRAAKGGGRGAGCVDVRAIEEAAGCEIVSSLTPEAALNKRFSDATESGLLVDLSWHADVAAGIDPGRSIVGQLQHAEMGATREGGNYGSENALDGGVGAMLTSTSGYNAGQWLHDSTDTVHSRASADIAEQFLHSGVVGGSALSRGEGGVVWCDGKTGGITSGDCKIEQSAKRLKTQQQRLDLPSLDLQHTVNAAGGHFEACFPSSSFAGQQAVGGVMPFSMKSTPPNNLMLSTSGTRVPHVRCLTAIDDVDTAEGVTTVGGFDFGIGPLL